MKQTLIFIMLSLGFSSCYTVGKLLVGLPDRKVGPLTFTDIDRDYHFVFPDTSEMPYYRQLRQEHHLNEVIKDSRTDREKALAILSWTHQQWKHNGSNQPSKSDAITILKEAQSGMKFRCVEYGIVSTDALLAVGMKARVLGLETRDVETVKSSAGHVLAEVWLREENKWAMIDGQFNVMPILNGVPLNAVEFQRAIIDKKDFKLVNSQGEVSAKAKRSYLNFVPPYLYYFDVEFDMRQNIAKADLHKEDGKTSLMLVPVGANNPTVFQRKYPMNRHVYTHSLQSFYAQPK